MDRVDRSPAAAAARACTSRFMHPRQSPYRLLIRPDDSVQLLDTKWVFDLKINTSTRLIERFKTRIVANHCSQWSLVNLKFYVSIVLMSMSPLFLCVKSNYFWPSLLFVIWSFIKWTLQLISFLLLSSLVN